MNLIHREECFEDLEACIRTAMTIESPNELLPILLGFSEDEEVEDEEGR